ncbi:hypothetical protein Clacol_000059 [Clathrus columnatus]|uniref:Uncharacterized protein n=1 Tax=Clathrus columnatus TaxID=1419009 RepID=A0AAV4ZXR5_9AGAM|nr:hypothetical protein Clacol_000059 [Clathrus columnatus]
MVTQGIRHLNGEIEILVFILVAHSLYPGETGNASEAINKTVAMFLRRRDQKYTEHDLAENGYPLEYVDVMKTLQLRTSK